MENSSKLHTPLLVTAAQAADAARGVRALEKKVAFPKRSLVPSEKSSDSSPVSVVTFGSKGRTLTRDSDLVSDSPSPLPKRHCSELGKGSPGAVVLKKWGIQGESDVTSANQGAVVDPSDTTGEEGDPTDLVCWPTSAMDFNLDPSAEIDAAEVEDTSGSATKKLPAASSQSVKDDHGAKDDHSNHDTQSESVAAASEAAEASDQQGNEGTSTSSAKKGKDGTPGKRKVKVDWTPDLHRRFVQAVEQLGVEKAIPSRILEIMGVKCLTRHNIASHLQKYRSHRRHLAAREAEAANWQQQRKNGETAKWPSQVLAKPGIPPFAWSPFAGAPLPGAPHPGLMSAAPVPGRPVMGMPPPGVIPGMPHPAAAMGAPVPGVPVMGHPQHGGPAMGMPMHAWGHPSMDHSQAHMWQRPGAMYPMGPPAWYGPDGSVWHYPSPFQQAPAVDMWGQPTGSAGYPGAGVVPGTPCFPPHMMPMPGAPQRIPSGISSSNLALVPGLPPAPSAPASSGPLSAGSSVQAPVSPLGAASVCASSAGQGFQGSPTAVVKAQAGGTVKEEDTHVEDSFLNDPLPDSVFNISDDLSLDFGTSVGSFSDPQASSALDAAISEALANPTTPLPLGLKPPAVDGVLEELQKQGITMLPPLKGCEGGGLSMDMIKSDFLDSDLLGEVDDQSLMLGGDVGEDAYSEDALKALLNP